MPHATFEHHHRAERCFDRDRLVGFVACRIAAAQMTARHDARRAVAVREFVETPRDVDALRRRRPRLGHEDLIRVQHALLAAGTDDVRRQIAEQRRPADHRTNQPQRRGMLDEFDENRIATQHVPHALIGVAVVEPEPRLLAPLREVVSGRAIQRGAGAIDLRRRQTRRRRGTDRTARCRVRLARDRLSALAMSWELMLAPRRGADKHRDLFVGAINPRTQRPPRSAAATFRRCCAAD